MLEFHHIGCIVDDIDASVELHRQTHTGSVSEKILIASQQVYVCFAELAPGSFLEFVQPAGPDSAVSGLRKKMTTYYHLGYKVNGFDAALARLDETGHRHISTFYSEAFAGKRCAFLMTPDLRLIELIEK